ncbi:Uncharacterized transporter [Sparassis crispa]|uniref:Uncharacterized transporter n=1 Tax=Sparassis crispa TaxID=139825 RepID=A0A401GJX5_9APHY|nr:Uncharacterized transporter [Sparassis crispa]GBE82449.1 Uncharacterized transporter [Sparassis crispa]
MSRETKCHGGPEPDIVPACSDDEVRTALDGRKDVKYAGSGTHEDPYLVEWEAGDPENPYNWRNNRKWLITFQLAMSTWTVSFCSSSYTGGLALTMKDLHMSQEVAILGVSLYVLGFGMGPLIFAPLGETYGRRIVFLGTFGVFALLHLGGSLGHNTPTLLVTRTLAGTFGSSPLTNAGGAIGDIWTARERGFASSLYATAPFMGPVVGPIVSGWVSQTYLGWRFNFWIMFMLSVMSLIFGFLVTPETYGPVLLRWRARKLRRESEGLVVYSSVYDVGRSKSLGDILKVNMGRPFYFLATEPIVVLLAIYIAVAYSTLYAFFAAYPIVFQDQRHFSPGQGGLAFLGVGLGVSFGLCLAPVQNRLYWREMDRSPNGRAPPEARLYMAIIGAVCLPVGLFWFACRDPVPWIVPVLAGVPFGTGVALIMQGITQYLMDAYQMYCASAIASTVVLRSIGAALFPLVAPLMYRRLGDGWACSIFGFLAVACMPLPYLFIKYGRWVRSKSRWVYKDDVLRSGDVEIDAKLTSTVNVSTVKGEP